MMLHDKTVLGHMVELLIKRGITDLVVSPGSRNAPIVTVFCKRPEFNCLTIVDERSAAFFALGMAQQLQKPVALACTSGSAALNYAPAIAEAYYQRIPLIVLTADRPAEWIDQGDGQTIRQHNVFNNYIKKSVQLPQSLKYKDDLIYSNRLISEALNACQYPAPGPVHINIPFTEPLYGFEYSSSQKAKDFVVASTKTILPEIELNAIADVWNDSSKKLVLVGQMPPNAELENYLIGLSKQPDVVILSETTSNLFHDNFISCIDRTLSAMPADIGAFAPELLLTIGGTIVSKRIKAQLRIVPVRHHWHIDPAALQMDTFQHLSKVIPMEPLNFLEQLMPLSRPTQSEFAALWQSASRKAYSNHVKFIESCPYSDLKIMETLFREIPSTYDVQLANSTPVRYSQLFEFEHPYRFDSNRGTSGIDGSVSTAAGAAYTSKRPTLMLTGDLGFFYDSNALWNKQLPSNLKIIVVNNEGGGIFRFIEGPDSTGLLDEYFEARHHQSARYIAQAFELDYMEAASLADLKEKLTSFFIPSGKPGLLEIKSPAEESAKILRRYFDALGK